MNIPIASRLFVVEHSWWSINNWKNCESFPLEYFAVYGNCSILVMLDLSHFGQQRVTSSIGSSSVQSLTGGHGSFRQFIIPSYINSMDQLCIYLRSSTFVNKSIFM